MQNFKTISLTVLSNKYPFELTISTCSGLFIARRQITSASRFCLRTNACCLRLVGQYQNQTIVKSYVVSNCSCQLVLANFNFTLVTTPQPLQTFTLLDQNYGLPVNTALLNFKNWQKL